MSESQSAADPGKVGANHVVALMNTNFRTSG